jgi:thiamine biosynthesis protein ThiS
MATALEIWVNGEVRQVPSETTVAELVTASGRDPRTVAVELNGEILARQRYSETLLGAGDRLEVVHFVQGG